MGKFIDLTGQRFGRLTVLSRAEDYVSPKGRHATRWLCKCDCGKIKTIHGTSLKQGLSTSCGCIPSREADDLSGNIYGDLTVLSRAKNKIYKNGVPTTMWNCMCKCGNKIVVSGRNLKQGHTKSCGCKSSRKIKKNLKENIFKVLNDHAEIIIGEQRILIDLDDVKKCINKYWRLTGYGYVIHKEVIDGCENVLLLHRYVVGITDKTLVVDHINGNIFDNRKSNLRICTQQQNVFNRKSHSEKYPGVDYLPYFKNKKWTVRIACNGKSHRLGYFDTEEEAIQARIVAEEKYHGEFGYYNSRIKPKENKEEIA